MKHLYPYLVVVCLFAGNITTSNAQLIQQYGFSGSVGSEATLPPNGQPTNGSLSHIRRGSGVTPPSGTAANAFGATGFTMATVVDSADYFEFAIKANTGFALNLDSVVVTERRSNTGIRKFAVRSSLDGFANNLSAFDVPDDASFRSNQRTNLGASFQNVASGTLVKFRYYGYAAEAETGTWRLDSIRIYGQILATGPTVPELRWLTTQATIVEGNSAAVNVGISVVSASISNFEIVQKSGSVSGSDYNLGSLSASNISIPAGQSSVGIDINALADALTENSENASWVIRSKTPGVLVGSDSILNLTITDPVTPTAPTASFALASQSVNENGDSIRVVVNLLPAASNSGREVSVVKKSGSAVLGTDYTAYTFTTMYFPPGVTNMTFKFGLKDDLVADGNKTMVIALRKGFGPSTPSPVIGADSIQTITIIDNESPAASGPPFTRTIAQVRGTNTNGGADSVGRNVRLYGTVYGLNQRLSTAGGGYQMYLRDATGGIGIFKTTPVNGITTLNEGDSVKIMGKIEVFRGLSQINPDSMVVLATGRPLKTPTVALKATEVLEGDLIQLNDVRLVDVSKWTTGIGTTGFTVKVYKGLDTTEVRIDNDCPLFSQPTPFGTFSLIGMGGQFTASSVAPYVGGYQIIPRKVSDLIPSPTGNTTTISWTGGALSIDEGTYGSKAIIMSPAAATAGTYTVVQKSGPATPQVDYSFSGDTPIEPGNTSQTVLFYGHPDVLDEGTFGFESAALVLRSTSPSVVVGDDSVFVLYVYDPSGPVETGPPFTRTIAQVRGNNSNGGADSVGRNVRLYGTVYGHNQRLTAAGGGYQMYLRDATGGIGIFKTTPINGITSLNEGDSIKIMGKIEVFRGLSQINPDSMVILATGRPLKTPTVALKATEALEADLIRLNGVQLVDPTKWTTGVGTTGFSVRVFKGLDTTDVRIDNDCPMYNQPAPTGTFDIIGMGGQFSTATTAPFVGGYQLIPRKTSDLVSTPVVASAVISWQQPSATVIEGNEVFRAVTISPAATQNGGFEIVKKSGSLAAGVDYSVPIYNFDSIGVDIGNTIKMLRIQALTDGLTEGSETAVWVLRSKSQSIAISADSIFTLQINDPGVVVTEPYPFTRTIAQVRGTNANGGADSVGHNVRLYGTVYGVNQRLTATTGGYQLFMRDATGGFGIFKTTPIAGITTLNEGDSIKVMGKIEVFRGLSQINPDSMVVIATGRSLKNPTIITALDEAKEADLVRFNNVTLVSPAAWTTGVGANGFTVQITDGTTITDVRIDNDCPLYNQPAPTGAFDLIGMGGQFSTSTTAPWAGGYQLIPRKLTDLITAPLVEPEYAFTFPNVSVMEAAVSVLVTVNGSQAPASDVMLDVVVKGGTATASSDYSTLSTTTITFPAGSTNAQTFNINPIDDALQEPTETIILAIRPHAGSTGFTIGADSIFTLSLGDNDSPVVVEPYPFTRTIAQVRGTNANGGADSVGHNVRLYGTVYGVNQRLTATTGGYQMFMRDASGGIGIFKTTPIAGITTLNEGDSIKIMGKIEVFRGLSQINPDSMVVLATGRSLKNPTIVTALDEGKEADLVRFNNVTLVSPAAWTTGVGASGFTVQITDGTTTTDVRIDNDCPLYNLPAPTTAFDLIGMGGQFTASTTAPWAGGYQLIPRKLSDLIPVTEIDPLCNCVLNLKAYPNPGSGQLVLETKAKTNFTYQIFNGLGKRVWEKKGPESTETLNTAAWAAGVYTIRVQETGHVLRWVKQ